MAPPTRSNPFKTPSPKPLDNKEATTVRKCRYYELMRRNRGVHSRRAIAAKCGITKGTARYWERQYKKMGSPALRRTRKQSANLGHKSKVTKSMCKLLVSPSRNPVKKQLYKVQIEYYKLPIEKRQL